MPIGRHFASAYNNNNYNSSIWIKKDLYEDIRLRQEIYAPKCIKDDKCVLIEVWENVSF